MELGLFPLGVVLLPTERIPLHIFEPRYLELIGECVDEQREFGLVFGDTDGVREVGTRAVVTEVVERLPDGRLNILVEALERFRALATLAGGEIQAPEASSGVLSFELAARVELPPPEKQELLELRSEPERLRRVTELLGSVLETVRLERELAARAATNGR